MTAYCSKGTSHKQERDAARLPVKGSLHGGRKHCPACEAHTQLSRGIMKHPFSLCKANRYLADPKRPQHLLSEYRVNFKMKDPRWPTENSRHLWKWRQPGKQEERMVLGSHGWSPAAVSHQGRTAEAKQMAATRQQHGTQGSWKRTKSITTV